MTSMLQQRDPLKIGEIKVGDVVIYSDGERWSRHDIWAKVERVTGKGTLQARRSGAHDKIDMLRPSRNGCYPGVRFPTEEELAHRKWQHERPKTKFVQMRGFDRSITGLEVSITDLGETDPEKASEKRNDLIEAANELVKISQWLGRRP